MTRVPGYLGGPDEATAATPLTRANLLVNDTSGGQWGSWGIGTATAMYASGGGYLYHADSSSTVTPANESQTGAAYGAKFVQRSAAGGWQTCGTWYSQPLLAAHTGLQFVHEMDCIPFDDESNPCLTNLYRFMWGLWNLNSSGLTTPLNPAGLHGCGVQFTPGTDTNYQFCADGGSGTLTRVDSGVAPADGVRYIFRAKYNGLVASAGSCVLEILDGDKVVLGSNTFSANGPAANYRINPIICWMSNATSIVRSLSIINQGWAMGLPT